MFQIDCPKSMSKSPEKILSPDRLSLARKRRRLTQKELADRAGLSPVTITRLMKGDRPPEKPTLRALASALEFPLEFLCGDYIDEPLKEGASFRSLTSITARERDAALAAGAIAYLLDDWATSRFTLPNLDLIYYQGEGDAASAAAVLRRHWSIGEAPISNMIALLESKGIRIFSLTENTKAVDAFSVWRNDQPYIFANTFKTAERSRFDIAHELGHLILHRHGGKEGREAEREANNFASAFLMPESDIIARIRRVSHLAPLIPAKKRWGVSLSALVYRIHKLKIISDWQYKNFCIQINRQYGTNEPYELPREKSIIWAQILKSLWQNGLTKCSIAEQLHLPIQEIDSLVFVNMNDKPVPPNGSGKPDLRIT